MKQQIYCPVTGALVNFMHTDPASIHLRDIARGLCGQNRYSGQLRRNYTVAQHSILVGSMLPPELRLAGYLHDAAEAYIQDIAAPLKQMLLEYYRIEGPLERVIEGVFHLRLSAEDRAVVKDADVAIRYDEMFYLCPNNPELPANYVPLGPRIKVLPKCIMEPAFYHIVAREIKKRPEPHNRVP